MRMRCGGWRACVVDVGRDEVMLPSSSATAGQVGKRVYCGPQGGRGSAVRGAACDAAGRPDGERSRAPMRSA